MKRTNELIEFHQQWKIIKYNIAQIESTKVFNYYIQNFNLFFCIN